MAEQNMQDFETMAKSILGFLKLTFPHPTHISPASLNYSVSRKGDWIEGEWVEGEPETEDEKLFNSTLRWLQITGYVISTEPDDKSLGSLILTEKGLDILNSTPKLRPTYQL